MHVDFVRWEYARLEYKSTGNTGTDNAVDWRASFHHPGGVEKWGVDERFDDIPHLNRAGAAGWQAYARSPFIAGQPLPKLYAVSYAMRRPVPGSAS